MSQQLLFFFSALGAFNGFLVGTYFLFFAKPKHLSNLFLGLLFIALSIRVGKSVFFYFYDNLAEVYIQFGLFACWLIGPLLYMYVRSTIVASPKLKRNGLLTIVGLSILALVIIFSFPRMTYKELWIDYLIHCIYLQWLLFMVLSGIFLIKYRKRLFIHHKNRTFKIWLLSIYFGNLIICIAFNTASYTSYIVGALSFSFVFYILVLLLLFYGKREQLLFLDRPKYLSNRITLDEADQIRVRLESYLKEEAVFLDANLTLAKVSNLLKIPTIKISQTFNEYLGIGFNDYINTLRISYAKKALLNKQPLSIEAIALDCGFNSKSTFYTAFKKHTGLTPSKFREANQL